MRPIVRSLVVSALVSFVSLAGSRALAQTSADLPPPSAPPGYVAAPAPSPPPVITVAPYGWTPSPSVAPVRATYSAPALRTPIGTRHEIRPDRGLWGAGVGLFIAGWALDIVGTLIANSISNRPQADEDNALAWSVCPLAGPIAQFVVGAPHPALPATFEIMQITGLVLFVMGMTSTADVAVYALGDASDPTTARLSFDVQPRDGGAFGMLTLTM